MSSPKNPLSCSSFLDDSLSAFTQNFLSGRIADINEVISEIRSYVPRRFRCTEPHLIAVNNGIFDYTAKKLWPFTHKLVFLSKSRVDYDAYALNPIIHNNEDGTDWDVETWMESLSDDPEIVQVLWEILGAIIRPHVRWNKSAWLYSESGNNGKGTLCELMRALCGPGTYASIPLSNFSKDFMLEPLTRATAIIVDENDVGTYIDKAANLMSCLARPSLPGVPKELSSQDVTARSYAPWYCQSMGSRPFSLRSVSATSNTYRRNIRPSR